MEKRDVLRGALEVTKRKDSAALGSGLGSPAEDRTLQPPRSSKELLFGAREGGLRPASLAVALVVLTAATSLSA